MKSLGEKIKEARKTKQLTQEELSELSKVNLRTIQRIENDENTPRGQTLNLICNALELDVITFKLQNSSSKQTSIASLIINGGFLVLLNIALMEIFGYSTLDTGANLNSKICAFLLSFLLPFFIVYKTQKMNNIERLLKFGSGFIFYILAAFFMRGFLTGLQVGLFSGLFPCLIIALSVLYYGNHLIKTSN
ncbi:helix-turn-helix domain-containing protein [Pontimicrobium aquaticum]|uniref:Helix-turn-helix transcriptional regulator n=1 Tax=Pontimicrobium aquaticum TaxID=2565367 RepID=A0A4U0EYA5_9FLAO|nr:helix-turn-helix transcriptional regulator [Pontimicrobium aquaticum]TJY36983.1 helix-turn-helix transcriptional regulator [Pontimicrobium aquaticum]